MLGLPFALDACALVFPSCRILLTRVIPSRQQRFALPHNAAFTREVGPKTAGVPERRGLKVGSGGDAVV